MAAKTPCVSGPTRKKLLRYRLNPQDIVTAVRAQNAQVPGGQTGAAPSLPGQQVNIIVNASSLLETVEDFAAIRLRTEADGAIVRLKDVARIELNEENFMGESRYNGQPGVGVALKLAPGANVMETTRAVKNEVAALARFFPAGLDYAYVEDRAPIVEHSIKAVVRTLFETIVLVIAVIFFFLQNWRATVIPTITIPVILLGVFAVLSAAGYSINTLTMFGMVLAIGLLVDDTIVVVENVERLMREQRLRAREAAIESMRQITSSLVGVAVVISSAFLPMAFMSGSMGVIYRQFSITIVSAMILSLLVALTLSPVLCVTLLRPHSRAMSEFWGAFNRLTERAIRFYGVSMRHMLRKPVPMLVVFGAIVLGCILLFWRLPTAFLPEEDQGTLFVDVQLPPGASFERTQNIVRKVEAYFQEQEKDAVSAVFSVMGWGFSGTGQASAMVFPVLKDWSERGKNQSAAAVQERAMQYFAGSPEAEIFVMAPPAIMELDNSAGFELELMDRSGNGHAALLAAKDELVDKAAKQSAIAHARYSGLDDTEQYELHIDRDKSGALGLDQGEINSAIAAYWGGEYINDFSDQGRTKKVIFQAEPAFRAQAKDFSHYHIRNAAGNMVPFTAFLKVGSTLESPKLTRYNGVPSLKIEGTAAPGKSSGEAMSVMDALVAELPPGFAGAWTGLSYQERLLGAQAPVLYVISVMVVFLCLAALYESWSIPFAVLLTLPVGIFGALAGVMFRGMNNDVYLQIALLTIVGLSAKNSILIIEFAKQMTDAGKNLLEATIEAARLRLRPIVMTSLCFVLGVLPLALNSGAGAGAQNALGTAVSAGMFAATCLGVYYTPLFFVLILKFFAVRKPHFYPD